MQGRRARTVVLWLLLYCGVVFAGDAAHVHVIPQAHIDLAWKWPYEPDTIGFIHDTYEGHASLLEADPAYTYCQSQIVTFEEVRVRWPELFFRIKALVDEGRWEMVGGEWVEADHNLPCGESLVRQHLYGQRYLRKHFGVESSVGWSPDSFGHCGNYPQILREAGLSSFIFKRPHTDEKLVLPTVPFYWTGIDGTRVLSFRTHNKGRGRVTEMDEGERVALGLMDLWSRLGCGDRGGVNNFDDLPDLIAGAEWTFSTPSRYVEALTSEYRAFPTHTGDLNYTFEGCYTTQAHVKAGNRRCENLLLSAEALSSMAWLEGADYPQAALRDAWLLVLLHQFHDDLPGSGIAEIYEDTLADYAVVEETAREATGAACAYLAGRIDTTGDGLPVVVWNTCSWPRTGCVEVKSPGISAEGLVAVGPTGLAEPVQATEGGVMFVARRVPALGWAVWHLREGASVATEGGGVTAELDDRGRLASVRARGSELLSAPVSYVLCDEGDYPKGPGAAWDLGLTGAQAELTPLGPPVVEESGPVRWTVVSRFGLGDCVLEQRVRLLRHCRHVELDLSIDWHEVDKLLRLHVPVRAGTGVSCRRETPYGVESAPTTGREFPAQSWVDVSGPNTGLALVNDSRYGHSVDGSVLRLSLLRCTTFPDERSDEGEFAVSLQLHPHVGARSEAELARAGRGMNAPLLAQTTDAHGGDLPPAHSFISVDSTAVHVGSVKLAEDGGALVMRLWETAGAGTDALVRTGFPLGACADANLLEDARYAIPSDDGALALHFGPYDIRTIAIKPGR